MKEQNRARPGLPPGARAEILEALCADMEISSDEIVAILKRHHVAEDADVLQDRYTYIIPLSHRDNKDSSASGHFVSKLGRPQPKSKPAFLPD